MDYDLKSVIIYWTMNSKFVAAYHAWCSATRPTSRKFAPNSNTKCYFKTKRKKVK